MRQITVAVVQTSPVLNEVNANLAAITKVVEDVSLREKVDLFVFPELCTTGFECGVRFADLAERVSGPTVSTIAQLASEYGTHIAFGMAERQKVESVVYSAAIVVDPEGEVIADYQKLHLKGEQRLTFRPGFKCVTAATSFGVIGLMVGWDLAFPEVSRSLAIDGAELLCVCGGWEEPHAHEWRSYAFARAYENAAFVAASNRVGQEPTYRFFGESVIVGPRGAVHGRLEDEAGVVIATLDLDEARQVQDETQLLQARQPRSYRSVVKMY